MKLICLPFAGGGSQSFLKWGKAFERDIELFLVDYAGHGRRFCEELTDSFESTLEDIFKQISGCTDSEYAIFGHSMGAIYAYELTKLIEKRNMRKPARVFVSGTGAPHTPEKKILSPLPPAEFMHEIYEFGGMEEDICGEPELMELFYPVLLNDIRNLENYRIEHKDAPRERISVPLTVLCGKLDREFTKAEAEQWKEYTERETDIQEFEGNHFFIFDEKEKVCELIGRRLLYY